MSAILVLGEKGLTEEQRALLRKELRNVSKLAEEIYEEGREEGRMVGRMEERMEIVSVGPSREQTIVRGCNGKSARS